MVSNDPRHLDGDRAEGFVAEQLLDAGWRVLARRLGTPYAEVDLLAIHPEGKHLVVIEVKARHSLSWGEPLESLRPRQHARLARALEYLAMRMAWADELRLDLCFVELVAGKPIAWQHFEALEAPAGHR
jgi:putative endonuclease